MDIVSKRAISSLIDYHSQLLPRSLSGVSDYEHIADGSGSSVFSDGGEVVRISIVLEEFFMNIYLQALIEHRLPIVKHTLDDIVFYDAGGEQEVFFVSVRNDIDEVEDEFASQIIDCFCGIRFRGGLKPRDDGSVFETLDMSLIRMAHQSGVKPFFDRLIEYSQSNPETFTKIQKVLLDYRRLTGVLFTDESFDNFGVVDDKIVIRDPYGAYTSIADLVRPAVSVTREFIKRSGLKSGNIDTMHREIPGFTQFWNQITDSLVGRAKQQVDVIASLSKMSI